MSAPADALTHAKSTDPTLQIIPLNHSFWLYRYPANYTLPESITRRFLRPVMVLNPNGTEADDKLSGKDFFSITRTGEEWSVMIQEEGDIPSGADSSNPVGNAQREGPWGCLKVRGPMILTLQGIAADLTAHLARASIPVFLISTWNTDYVFVKKDLLGRATDAVRVGGWVVV